MQNVREERKKGKVNRKGNRRFGGLNFNTALSYSLLLLLHDAFSGIA
jgi:hypothetical protein